MEAIIASKTKQVPSPVGKKILQLYHPPWVPMHFPELSQGITHWETNDKCIITLKRSRSWGLRKKQTANRDGTFVVLGWHILQQSADSLTKILNMGGVVQQICGHTYIEDLKEWCMSWKEASEKPELWGQLHPLVFVSSETSIISGNTTNKTRPNNNNTLLSLLLL